jgi:hypothetical protein
MIPADAGRYTKGDYIVGYVAYNHGACPHNGAGSDAYAVNNNRTDSQMGESADARNPAHGCIRGYVNKVSDFNVVLNDSGSIHDNSHSNLCVGINDRLGHHAGSWTQSR